MDKQTKRTFLNKFTNNSKHDTAWERYFNPTHKKHAIIKERFTWQTNQAIGPKIIDIGCGSGLGSYLAAIRGDIYEIHAIDVWEATLKRANDFISQQPIDIRSKIAFHQGFAEDLKFNDGYFDCAILGEVLEHVYDEQAAIKEAHRVCRKGAIIVASVPDGGGISINHVREFNQETFKKLIGAYFEILSVGKIGSWIICKATKSF